MKIAISLALILATFTVLNAQENPSSNTAIGSAYKQNSGDKSFEVNFDPGKIFGSNNGSQFGLFDGGIKFRMFLSQSSAFRMGLNLAYSNNTNIFQQEDLEFSQLELKSKTSSLAIMLKPGYEKHFGDLEKLSPYIGAQALIGYSTTTYMEERQSNVTDIYTVKWINDPTEAGYGRLSVGAGIFAGVDYYFVKKLYLGIEVGYGVQYSSLLKSRYVNEQNPDLDDEMKHGSDIGISPSLATGNLRLGWTF